MLIGNRGRNHERSPEEKTGAKPAAGGSFPIDRKQAGQQRQKHRAADRYAEFGECIRAFSRCEPVS